MSGSSAYGKMGAHKVPFFLGRSGEGGSSRRLGDAAGSDAGSADADSLGFTVHQRSHAL